jgi:hypothetical protein
VRPFVLRAAILSTDPELEKQSVNGKTNPKRHAEKLVWLKVSEAASREEESHNRTCGGDTK